MRAAARIALLLFLMAIGVCASSRGASRKKDRTADTQKTASDSALTEDDRLSLIAAALDSRVRDAEPDCSHMVHAIYEQAGFTYAYAPSSDLYGGVDGFLRVKQPEPGDLVAWRGHVGIVIKPSQHLFFSVLSTGPGVDDYTTAYWKHRGKPRFYRYVKAAYGPQPSAPKLVRTNRVRAVPEPETDDGQ